MQTTLPTPLYCKNQCSTKCWKQAGQTLSDMQVPQQCTSQSAQEHSKGLIHFAFHRANPYLFRFHALQEYLYQLRKANYRWKQQSYVHAILYLR